MAALQASPRIPGRLPAMGRGFTLVEVLVALLIMAVIAGMGWQGVDAMSRAREHTTAATERTLRLATLVSQWEQDLQAIYDGQRVPALQFDGASLRLVRRVDDGVQVVVWSLRDGVWRRWASPTIDRQGLLEQTWMASMQLQGSESAQLKLLDKVSGWQVYFFRGQAWANAQSSADVAAPAAARPAPPPPPPQPPTGGAPGPVPVGQAIQAQQAPPRELLPTGVRLQLDLAEGRINRDVLLSPQVQQ